jgi:hypothetical protein
MMNIIKTDIKNLQDIAPLIDDDIIDQYNQKYRRFKRVKKPNFVNGLTEVKINSAEDDYDYASRQGSREQSPTGRSENGNGHDNDNDQYNDHTLNANTNGVAIITDDAESVEPTNNKVTPSSSPINPLQQLQQLQQLQERFSVSNTNSPAHSIRSNASLQISGVIRKDASGNSTLSA